MKIVMDKHSVAHAWMNQTQKHGKNPSGTLYFENESIYSYGRHFVIAKHAVGKNGDRAILFTQRTFRQTTVKHIAVVCQATHGRIIWCPDPGESPSYNFSKWKKRAEENGILLGKARKPEIYLNEISRIEHQVNEYATFIGVEVPKDLKDVLSLKDKGKWADVLAKAKAREKKQREELEAHKARVYKINSEEFLSYQRDYLTDGNDLLRFTFNSRQEIETTQRVVLKIHQVNGLWKKIKSGDLKAGDRFGDWLVKEVSDNVLEIGCHKFDMSFIRKFVSENPEIES